MAEDNVMGEASVTPDPDPRTGSGGTYEDAAEKIPMDQRFQQQTMPQGPDPSPFKLNTGTPSGGR